MENNIRLITNSLLMLVISVLFITCSRKEKAELYSNENSILCGHEYKIWKLDNVNHESYGTHFYFDNKGNCINLSLSNKGKFSKYQANDVIVNPTWHINGDTLFLEQVPYMIEQSSIDTIRIKDIEIGKINYLIDIGIPPKIEMGNVSD